MILPFALIVPGEGPITNFLLSNDIYHFDLINPGTVANLCLALTNPLPDGYAITLSYSAPPYTEMQYIGAVSNNRPSDIFAPGFPLRPDISCQQSIKLCLKAQRFDEIVDLVLASDGKKEYSKLVAQNLYNFMLSYSQNNVVMNGPNNEYLMIPSNFLHKWMQKFEEKYAKDPNFILKTTYE